MDHDERIASVLALKAHQAGYELPTSADHCTPLSALLASEEGEDESAQREQVIAAFIDFVLQDGVHPAHALKNFYAVVHALRPQAMPGDWTCKDYADLFGETKAAHSWRVKQLFGARLEARGAKPIKARFQKSASATANYSAAQKGNRNRRHGLPRPEEARRAA